MVKLSKLTRWDYYNKKYNSENDDDSRPLRQLIKSKPFYGAPYSALEYDGKVRYIRITDINEDGSLTEVKVSANQYDEKYLLHENDFLIARSGNTVGKTFLYSKRYGPAIFAGYLIKFEINEQLILPHYLLAYTKTPLFKKWINSNMRVSAQPNINCQQYLDAPIIVPDMEKQKEIVEFAENRKKKKIALLAKSIEIRNEAIQQFYHTIFE